MLFELAGMPKSARVRTIATGWLLAAAISAAMGLLQYLGLADRLSPWVDFVEAGQAYANLRQRNQLATLLGIGLSALLWLQVSEAPRKPEHFVARSWPLGFALLLAAADAATSSRTGFVQLLLLAALSLLWRRGRGVMVCALLGYAVAAFVLPLLLPHAPLTAQTALQTGILARVGEVSGRGILWDNVLHLIALKPWLGWGWGELHYAHFITLYAGERFVDIMGNAHNLPLHLAVELGVPVSISFCVAVLWLVLRAQPWRERRANRQLAWSVLAVIGVHSLLEYPLWYGPFQLAAVLAVWVLLQPRPFLVDSASHGLAVGTKRPSLGALFAAAALATACSYAGWDYWRISQIYLPVGQRAAEYRDDTLNKIRASWLFQRQVQFAELGITPVTADNAQHINALAKHMLHFSPEAGVVQKLIDSAILLGQEEEVAYYAERFKVAYPQEYAAWLASRSAARHKTP
jgi:O-antigen ligase